MIIFPQIEITGQLEAGLLHVANKFNNEEAIKFNTIESGRAKVYPKASGKYEFKAYSPISETGYLYNQILDTLNSYSKIEVAAKTSAATQAILNKINSLTTDKADEFLIKINSVISGVI